MEQNKKAVACIKENLMHTHLNDKAVVMSKDVMTALRLLDDEKQTFDYIFMDPPYGKLLEKKQYFTLMILHFVMKIPPLSLSQIWIQIFMGNGYRFWDYERKDL